MQVEYLQLNTAFKAKPSRISIIKAEMLGISLIIEMDSNSKLGPDLIPQDPHKQSPNGKILAGIIQRRGLIVANGLEGKCTGSITRRRETVETVEESIIDHVIMSSDLLKYFESLLIDKDRIHCLTSLRKTKKGIVKKPSDHNAIISKFNFNWNNKIPSNRIKMFNLKNVAGQTNVATF